MITYYVYIKDNKDYAINNIIEFFVLPLGAMAIILSVVGFFDNEYEFEHDWLVLVIGIITTCIIIKKFIKDIKNKKINFKYEFLKMIYSALIWAISVNQDEYYLIFGSFVIITFIECIKQKKSNIKENKNIQINLNLSDIVAFIIVLLLIFVILSNPLDTSSSIFDDSPTLSVDVTFDYNQEVMYSNSMIDTTIKGSSNNSNNSNKGIQSILNGLDSINDKNTIKEEIVYENSDNIENNIKENSVAEDENVRNVFLESLCFIPEIVTENGKLEEKIKLSDNITTWQIQTIANTKNGNVGYANGNFKVFKEFFVDFSMPTNSVVGDKISLPVTVYNYTDEELNVELSVKKDSWFNLNDFNNNISVEAKSSKMIYIPIEILTAGENSLRIEGKAGDVSDIIQLPISVKPNGVKISKVLNSGSFEKEAKLDSIFDEKSIEGTKEIKVKLYPSTMTTIVEGLDNIFKMPTGCFEQTSSSLYPNIVALKYMEENEIIDNELKNKALEYISAGYQRILTFEVPSEKGGYSLYGKAPAETVLTAYGLMELKDLTSVYEVDENVINNMREFLYKQQNLNGTFKLNSDSSYSKSHVVGNSNELALNSYVIWALSESFPEDSRLEKSIEYLEQNLDKINDNYTLALIANAFANTKNKNTDKVVKRLVKAVTTKDETVYMESNICDYWGSRGVSQELQTTALTSLVLSKTSSNTKTNKALIENIISRKDANGTWRTTQGTILALKALNEFSAKNKIEEQDIIVTLNETTKTIHVEKNSLDLYEAVFEDVDVENKIKIENKKGQLFYEVVQESYVTYDEFSKTNQMLKVSSEMDTEYVVNDKPVQKINIKNENKETISNGMVEITIPQGFSVEEDALSKLETLGIIEKYEYNYNKIYLYFRNFAKGEEKNLQIKYLANYPEAITGGMVRVYDYYNPEIEGYTMPIVINVK